MTGLWLVLIVAVARAILLHLFLDFVCLLAEAVEVPFGGLTMGEGLDEGGHGHGVLLFLGEGCVVVRCDRELAWDEAAFGQGGSFVLAGDDDGVDGEVCGHVPHLCGFLEAGGDVLEDEVVEFVDEDATHLGVREGGEEVRVPVHRDVVVLLVERHASRRDVHGWYLANVP